MTDILDRLKDVSDTKVGSVSMVSSTGRDVPVVLFVAPALTVSGYGVHSRQILNWLVSHAERGDIDLYVELLQWGVTPWVLDDAGLNAKLERYSRPPPGHDDIDLSIQVCLPNEWRNRARVNVGVTALVESTECNPYWLHDPTGGPSINAMDLVIVPSKHVARTIDNTARLHGIKLKDNVRVVPESFIPEIPPEGRIVDERVNELLAPVDDGFNFLVVGQLTSTAPDTDRKAVVDTIGALIEAFEGDESVSIIVKTNVGKCSLLDFEITSKKLNDVVRSKRGSKEHPRVHLMHGRLSDRQMAALYTHERVHALVSFTHGEGFGLPILEAAAAGLPVAVTPWSGHMDFLGYGKFTRLPYDVVTIPSGRVDKLDVNRPQSCIWVPNTKWASVERDGAIKALRRLRESNEKPREWARDLRRVLHSTDSKFTVAAVNRRYDEVIGQLIGLGDGGGDAG